MLEQLLMRAVDFIYSFVSVIATILAFIADVVGDIPLGY
jgi:hypothetical protein